MRSFLFSAALVAALSVAAVRPAAAQPAGDPATNADVYGRLAVACLADAPVPGAVALDVPLPYLRSALTTVWTGAGRRVVADTAAATRIEIRTEQASVAYERAGRGRLGRTVTLGLRTRIVEPDGAVVYDAPCAQTARDVVPAEARGALESVAFGETVGRGPAPSRLRRTAETAVLAGALVTGTLLLFTLRSR